MSAVYLRLDRSSGDRIWLEQDGEQVPIGAAFFNGFRITPNDVPLILTMVKNFVAGRDKEAAISLPVLYLDHSGGNHLWFESDDGTVPVETALRDGFVINKYDAELVIDLLGAFVRKSYFAYCLPGDRCEPGHAIRLLPHEKN